jgi:hypothetical protein
MVIHIGPLTIDGDLIKAVATFGTALAALVLSIRNHLRINALK